MSVVNPSTTPADSWDYAPPAQPALRASQRQVIPDDWDADEPEDEEEPQRLWDNANKKAPMPELVISSTSTSSSVVPPPVAAFRPSLRILKRPSASTPSSSTQSSSSIDAQQKTYAEREAQYQAARERIFGGGTITPPTSPPEKNRRTGTRSPGSSSDSGFPTSNSSTVIRNPRGPESASQDTPRQRGAASGGAGGRGFAARRGSSRKGLSERMADPGTPPPG